MFVPAGIVLHDPVVLADTVSLRTAQVAHIALAPTDTEAADLTGPASGYAVEVTTTQSITVVFAFTPKEPNGRAIHLPASSSHPAAPVRPSPPRPPRPPRRLTDPRPELRKLRDAAR